MAEASVDSYATAKANLRDTIKWLATSLAALGAAVVAGVSINGLAGLEGTPLLVAVISGGAGLLAILVAISIMLSLLASDVLYFSEIAADPNHPISREIKIHAKDVLPGHARTIGSLLDSRDSFEEEMDKAREAKDVPAFEKALKKYTSADQAIADVASLAQFLQLRNSFRSRSPLLILCTIVAIAALGVYSLVAGSKSSVNSDIGKEIVFSPGNDWSAAATAFSSVCGSDQMNGTIVSKKTSKGWTAIRISGPAKCSGLEISVPDSLIKLGDKS
jgi:hypothetical protein